MTKELAATNERAAHAEERAAQANLELAKLKTPRTLNFEQQKRVSAAVEMFTGTPFDIAVNEGVEPQGLLPQIEEALKAAGWVQIDWHGTNINFTRKGRPVAGIVFVTGVVVQMHSGQVLSSLTAAQALASALNAQGIAARAEPGIVVPNTNTKAIHILVGEKPK